MDIWALGVLVYYMLSLGEFPFNGITKCVVNNQILNDEPNMSRFKEGSAVTREAKHFILKCLTKSVADRPSAQELLENDEWLKSNL